MKKNGMGRRFSSTGTFSEGSSSGNLELFLALNALALTCLPEEKPSSAAVERMSKTRNRIRGILGLV